MRTVMMNSRNVAIGALALMLLTPALVSAQDADKKPNILLVVDTSGSMEYETGRDTYPTCYPAEPDPTQHTKSRWIEVLEVLTGSINNYACAAVDRSSSNFIEEFSMADTAIPPPDANYRNPYHRPLSNSCAITANRGASGTLTNAFDWAPPLQTQYPVNPALPLASCATAFSQVGDGFVDIYNDLARFGLMTFDPLPDPGTGHSGASFYTPQDASGVAGTWSYYGSGSPAQGKPADCAALETLEVGARNGAAPATEGKMIYFGDQDLSDTRDRARHDRLQSVLLGTRPYGATPINGVLEDVRHFFWEDSDLEPTGQTAPPGDTLYGTAGTPIPLRLSPRFDQYVECGCRDQHVILITDGEPNLDLRPHCEQLGTFGEDGVCPFPDTPEEILADLSSGAEDALNCETPAAGTNRYRIITHVIGYAISTYEGGARDCTDLRSHIGDWDTAGGTCDTTLDPDLKVCCTLHRLAAAGSGDGSGTPYIAPTGADLQSSLSSIMLEITGGASSATRPVRSPGIGLADNTMKAFRLLTSYDPTRGVDGLWYGNIERMRWTCETGVPEEQEKLESSGDDFHRNVALNLGQRQFVTFIPDVVGGLYRPTETLRPHYGGAPDDGAGTRGGTQVTGLGTGFSATVPAGALELNYVTDAACTSTGAGDDNTCRTRVLDWTLGYDDGAGNNRCPNPADENNCSVIGDILHSTPTIVDRPTGVVEDETYSAFAEHVDNQGRMMMAYVSSNDGQLHGFGVSPNAATDPQVDDNSTNNEHFSFLPPAVLPRLKSQYPSGGGGSRMQLLDGVAVVQDVVAVASATPGYNFRLERSAGDTQNKANTWRTILVQAFGGAQPGYFALDITDPRRPSEGGGPIFLWQLTTSSTPENLFGTGGQPIITTVNLDGAETAVAVLPGGSGGSPLGGDCPRSNPSAGTTWDDTHYDAGITGTEFEPRPRVNCYSAADSAARSLTIVRLDSGEILRRFIRQGDPTLGLTGVFGNSPTPGEPYLDSPITGTPAAYPAGPGMISDRIFVGDQDGTLWRVDLSNSDPAEWTMKLFFDSYVDEGPTEGKPIITPPVLSVDERGQITIAYGTGDQDLSGTSGDYQYVYSLREVENLGGTDFVAKVNWATRLENGEHIIGPMSLLEGVLYFSTVDPSGSNECFNAPTNIWGVDYIMPQAAEPFDPFQGGRHRLQPQGQATPVQSISVTDVVGDDAGPVYGVSLEYVPTCHDESVDSNDFIPGSRTSVSNPSQSNLQLVFQTGSGTQGAANLNFTTSFTAINLVPPRTASTILSWAAVLE